MLRTSTFMNCYLYFYCAQTLQDQLAPIFRFSCCFTKKNLSVPLKFARNAPEGTEIISVTSTLSRFSSQLRCIIRAFWNLLWALHVVLNLPQLPHLDFFTLKDTGIKTNWHRCQNHCNLLELKSILYHIDRDKYSCAKKSDAKIFEQHSTCEDGHKDKQGKQINK